MKPLRPMWQHLGNFMESPPDTPYYLHPPAKYYLRLQPIAHPSTTYHLLHVFSSTSNHPPHVFSFTTHYPPNSCYPLSLCCHHLSCHVILLHVIYPFKNQKIVVKYIMNVIFILLINLSDSLDINFPVTQPIGLYKHPARPKFVPFSMKLIMWIKRINYN